MWCETIRSRRSLAAASSVALAFVFFASGCGGSNGPVEPIDSTPPESTNGILWNRGRLWIAAIQGSQLVQIDPASGAITRGYGPDDGLTANDDLVIVNDGAFILTEPSKSTVSRFDPQHGRTVLAEIGSQVNGITRCDDDRVFVNREWPGGGVYEIDPKGVNEPRLLTKDVPALNSMACVGDDLFAPTFALDGGVIRIHRETGAVENVASGMVLACAAHTMPDGTLVALQAVFPARLVKVDVATGALTEIARLGAMIPDNFAVGPDGTFYVTDFLDAGVVVISPDGSSHRIEL